VRQPLHAAMIHTAARLTYVKLTKSEFSSHTTGRVSLIKMRASETHFWLGVSYSRPVRFWKIVARRGGNVCQPENTLTVSGIVCLFFQERESECCGRIESQNSVVVWPATLSLRAPIRWLRRCCNRRLGLCDFILHSERVAEKMPEYCVESSLLARLR